MTLADGIMATYLHSTDLLEDKVVERKEDWVTIRRNLYQLKYEIQIIDIAKLWSPEVCLKKFEQNDELLKLANANLARIIEEMRKRTDVGG